MAPTEWYYAENGQQRGPVSSAELKQLARSGRLQPEDHIWREGMDDWSPAARLKGLFPSALTSSPAEPPIETRSFADTPIDSPSPPERPSDSLPPIEATEVVQPQVRPTPPAQPPARTRALPAGFETALLNIQCALWGFCAVVAVIGSLALLIAWVRADGAADTTSAAATYLAASFAAYALARASERIAALLKQLLDPDQNASGRKNATQPVSSSNAAAKAP